MYRPYLFATLFVCWWGTAEAGSLFEEDFSSVPSNKITSNGNSNWAGTGDATDLNRNEWLWRKRHEILGLSCEGGQATLNLVNNVYHLIDLSDMHAGHLCQLSFDVISLRGDVQLIAYVGHGLEYSGRNNGHLFFRMVSTTPVHRAMHGATTRQVLDGTSTHIAGTGRFSTPPFRIEEAGKEGAYLLLGFVGTSATLTIDNLLLSAGIPEPTSLGFMCW